MSAESTASIAIRGLVRMGRLAHGGKWEHLMELGDWFEKNVPRPLVEELCAKLEKMEGENAGTG